MVTVERITSPSDLALADVQALLQQLRSNASEALGSQEDIDAITTDPHTLFVAVRDDGKTVGMATAYVCRKFGKVSGFVEDVVVSDEYRGQGLGRKVMEVLIQEASKAGVTQLYLTSKPERVAANALYQKLGFEQRKTNVYKLKL